MSSNEFPQKRGTQLELIYITDLGHRIGLANEPTPIKFRPLSRGPAISLAYVVASPPKLR